MVRIVRRFVRKRNWRMIFLWIISSLFFLLASMLAGQLQKRVGTSDIGYLVGFITSLLLFLFATLFLMATSIALKEEVEEWI